MPLHLGAVYFGNTILAYLQAAGVFVAVVAVFTVVQSFAVARLRALAARTTTDLDDFAIDVVGGIRSPEFHLVAFYLATRPLVMPAWLDKGFRGVVIIAVTYRVLRIIQRTVEYAVGKALKPGPAGLTDADKHTQRNITYVVNVFLTIVAVLFLLSNLGFNVTSMIAGLGVGGIAVALAAQAVLGDLFSAVAIFLDKPFIVGDAILWDGDVGVVERIGLKTTRIRLLSGDIMIVPNASLTSSKIRNFRDYTDRRVVFGFGIVYDTPAATVERIPSMVKEIVAGVPETRFDRAHFLKFGDSSLDFEIVYYVEGGDYLRYMDRNQAVLLGLMRRFEKEKIGFAFPTRTVQLVGPLPRA